MARLGDLVVTIGAKTASFDTALGKSMRKMQNFGRSTQRLGQQISMRVTAPLAIMGATSIRAFQVQAKAIAQVEAGLRSTGGQVGYTSDQLQKMASDLQRKTLFGDEQILKDATAQLLTFTNISGDQFARTQKAALDLATRLDGDLKGASIQLGKALNDPVANLSALSRSGIQFSDEQKSVIKSLAETGQLAEAQTLILDELNKQYGGSAEAAAEADGGITQLRNAFGDLQEMIGQTLMPMLKPLIDRIREMLERFQGMDSRTRKLIVTIGLIAGAIGPVLYILPMLARGLKVARSAMLMFNKSMLANPYVLAAAALAGLGYVIYKVATRADAATRASQRMNDAMRTARSEAAKETVKVQVLAKQYKMAGDNLDERKKVMDKIKAISPEYFGNLSAEQSSYEDITTAITSYNDALMKKAMTAAMESELQSMAEERVKLMMDQNEQLAKQTEIENKIADIKARRDAGQISGTQAAAEIAIQNAQLLNYNLYVNRATKSLNDHDAMMNNFIDSMATMGETTDDTTNSTNTNTDAVNGNTDAVTGNGDAVAKTAEELAAEAEAAAAAAAARAEMLDKLNAENDARKAQLEFMRELRGLQAEEITAAPSQQREAGAFVSDLPDELDGLDFIPDAVDDFESDFTVDEVAFEKFQRIEQRAKMFKDMMSGLMEGLTPVATNFGNAMGNAFGQMAKGAKDGEEALKSATKGMINQALAVAQASIIEAMVSSGKFSGPAAPIVIPALVAGGIGLIQGLFNDIPAFAAGGIVSGPTLGLMGEYSGAASNPEVIAPLDKLQGMMGGQQVQVVGKIDGNSIRLSNDRSNRNAKRFLR